MSKATVIVGAFLILAGCSAPSLSGGQGSAQPKGGSSSSWMGVYGDHERHSGGNPGSFSVLMNQDYLGLHADLVLRVDGGEWQRQAMDWLGNVEGDSLWGFVPADSFEPGSTVDFFFHGYDDWGSQI